MSDRDQKIKLEYKEFVYKKTENIYKLEDWFLQNGLFSNAHTRNHR